MNKRVLVVDDQFQSRRGTLEILKHVGYQCFEASEKSQALVWLEKEKVDLIITDAFHEPEKLPSFINEIFQQCSPERPQVVVYCTDLNADHVSEIKKSGASGVWKKPLFPNDFISKLREIQGFQLTFKDDDKITGISRIYEGMITPEGDKITGIFRKTPNWIVYLVESKGWKRVGWEYDPELPPYLKCVDEEARIIRGAIDSLFSGPQHTKALERLGQAVSASFASGIREDILKNFEPVRELIKERAINQYIRSGIYSAIITITLCVLVTSSSQITAEVKIFTWGIIAGIIGASISLIHRRKTLRVSTNASRTDINFGGFLRVILGLLFGGVAVLLFKAEILSKVVALDFSNAYIVYVVALFAGFSERFIPELIRNVKE